MTYFACTYSNNQPTARLDLSRQDYNELVRAREIDFSQFAIENKYQILLDNYAELEEELLRFSLNLTIRTPDLWDALDNANPLFARRVLNFLSSARMYLDQVPGDLGVASREPEHTKEQFEKSASIQYDSSLAYRVCEALRNYTQHKDLPVHGVSHGWRREHGDTKNITTTHSGLTLDISKLESDGKFKSTVLEELRKGNDKHDLKNYLRQYMHSLGLIHLELRASLTADGDWAINLITQVIAKVKALPAADPQSYVFLASGADNGKVDLIGRINTERFDRRKFLEAQSRNAPPLTQVKLSSE